MITETVGTVSYATAGFGGKLVEALVSDFEQARPFLHRNPGDETDWLKLLDELKGTSYPRRELCAALQTANAALNAPDLVSQNIKALEDKNTFAVLTGQQAGLFGGPLYTLFKALTAIKLAQQLQERFPINRFVPIFWVASDDHDLGEIDHADIIDANGELKRLKAELPVESAGASAGDVCIADNARGLTEPLNELLKGTGEALLEPYRDATLGEAFSRLLMNGLGSLGLIVVESTLVRRFGGELFAHELQAYSTTRSLVREAGQRLKASGFEYGFEETRMAPHLFLSSHEIRAHLDPESEGTFFQERSYAFAEKSRAPKKYALKELLDLAAASPERFSPTAALRPVLQNKIFPTIASILGPGETAYWAQLKELHDHYEAVWPMIVPRASFTLLDTNAQRALRKLKADLGDLFLPLDAFRQKVFSGGRIGEELAQRTQSILNELDAMHAAVQKVDRGLDPLFQKARTRIGNELEKIEQKTNTSLSQRDGAGEARFNYLMNFTRPRERPQERVLCLGSFLAQYPELPAAILEQIDPLTFSHKVLKLD